LIASSYYLLISYHLLIWYAGTLQGAIEPGKNLQEGLFFRKPVLWFGKIGARCEAMGHAGKLIDLIRLTSLDQNFLGVVTDLCSDRSAAACNSYTRLAGFATWLWVRFCPNHSLYLGSVLYVPICLSKQGNVQKLHIPLLFFY
jgi:hypothetical protein